MQHALVVGGTGMLADTSLWLVSQGYHVSVIGRNRGRMGQLIGRSTNQSQMTPILVDYNDDFQLIQALKSSVEINGPIQLVVAWIHSYAERALQLISQEIAQSNESWKLFHVLGSSTNLTEMKEEVKIPDSCQYHQVQLGFVIENGHSRWLTNKEISQGVIEAIYNDTLLHIVGTLEPWEKRP